ncbi:MAG: flap endonuclease-1 [Candidatus Aenigmarchaeota archaeon]|nr:flap endonuclease-1 [Candidatus Aenigmarchaeota archaeon]MDI6722925.1 flap endonuclease-1 [Candidatus Aenigmarchaeota archaeon]
MGIQLTDIIDGEEITLEDLLDKRIAVDAYNWLYQFLSIIRQADGEPLKDSRGNITSHLSGLFYRTLKLMEAGIKPVYVFDGKPTEMKRETNEKRRDVREEAKEEWEKALKRGDYESAKKYAQRSSTLTEDMVKGAKDLLDALGVPWMQAPNEGEALCSVMCGNGDAYAVSSQDYDTLLFGAPRLIRNLSITGKRKRGNEYINVNPEMIQLSKILEKLDITRDQMIIIGMLIGTDYNPGGVLGYGPKKSLDLVKEEKTLDKAMEKVTWSFDIDPQEIFDFFRHPKEADYDIKFSPINEAKVKKILVDEHDFSHERVENAIGKLGTEKSQSSLARWAK